MFGDPAARLAQQTWTAFSFRERVIAIVGSILCILIFVGFGSLLDVPQMPRLEGSFLSGSAPVMSIFYLAISLAVCSGIGAVVGGMLEFDAGIFCVAIGLAAASVRAGSMRTVLDYAASPAVFLTLVIETALIVAGIFGVRILQGLLFKTFWSEAHLTRRSTAEKSEVGSPEPSQIALGIFTQVVAMSLCGMLLLQSDEKAQVLIGLGLSGYVAALVSYQAVPLRHGFWYWLGPVVVAAIGYIAAYLSPTGWMIGGISGFFGALSRPLPIDYASVGIAGTILGHWTARRWAQGEE